MLPCSSFMFLRLFCLGFPILVSGFSDSFPNAVHVYSLLFFNISFNIFRFSSYSVCLLKSFVARYMRHVDVFHFTTPRSVVHNTIFFSCPCTALVTPKPSFATSFKQFFKFSRSPSTYSGASLFSKLLLILFWYSQWNFLYLYAFILSFICISPFIYLFLVLA